MSPEKMAGPSLPTTTDDGLPPTFRSGPYPSGTETVQRMEGEKPSVDFRPFRSSTAPGLPTHPFEAGSPGLHNNGPIRDGDGGPTSLVGRPPHSHVGSRGGEQRPQRGTDTFFGVPLYSRPPRVVHLLCDPTERFANFISPWSYK